MNLKVYTENFKKESEAKEYLNGFLDKNNRISKEFDLADFLLDNIEQHHKAKKEN